MTELVSNLLFIACFMGLHHLYSGQVTSVYTVSRWPGRSNSVNNISLFTEKIILKCPEGVGVVSPSWGRIIGVDKRDKGLSQCFDNNAYNCTLSGGVNVLGQTYFGYEDSGLYFCKDDESSKEYYINLTILTPPQITGADLFSCSPHSYHSSHCRQGQKTVDRYTDRYLDISVAYLAPHNATVTWSRDQQPINCSDNPICKIMSTSNGIHHTETLRMMVYYIGHDSNLAGTYTANVSNIYGWNTSSTVVKYECHLTPPPADQSRNNTQILTEGDENVTVSCSQDIQSKLSRRFGMCYAPNGENFTELNTTSNCLLCDDANNGSCKSNYGLIIPRPKWKVKVQIKLLPSGCYKKVTTNLEIPKVVAGDNYGIVYCVWKDAKKHLYDQYRLEIQTHSPPKIKNILSPYFSFLTVFVLVTIIVSIIILIVLLRRCRHTRTIMSSTSSEMLLEVNVDPHRNDRNSRHFDSNWNDSPVHLSNNGRIVEESDGTSSHAAVPETATDLVFLNDDDDFELPDVDKAETVYV